MHVRLIAVSRIRQHAMSLAATRKDTAIPMFPRRGAQAAPPSVGKQTVRGGWCPFSGPRVKLSGLRLSETLSRSALTAVKRPGSLSRSMLT